MASERERAKEEYLILREKALKVEKKYSLIKMLSDILYMLCGGVIIGALIYMFSVWTQIEGGDRVVRILLFAAGFVGATPVVKNAALRMEKTKAGAVLEVLLLLALLLVCTAYLVDGSFSPFLYFRF
jgi:hypothetical protein